MRGPQSLFRAAKAYVSGPDVALPSVLCSKRSAQPESRPEVAEERSSEKSCQDGVSARGENKRLDVSGTQSGGMSSHGSIGQGSSQPQELEGCRVSERCAQL